MHPLVRLEKVSRRFGKVRALDELSLEVREGEIYGFLGRNGAGKTTTLRILIGILKPDAGHIELFGSRVRRVTVPLKQRIGYVSQEPNFYPWMTAARFAQSTGRLASTPPASIRDDLVGVEVRLDGPAPEGWRVVVRFRPADESPLDTYVTRSAVEGVAWQLLDELANDEVCFQAGLEASRITLFEAWHCLPLDSAAVGGAGAAGADVRP
jgi:ABC-type Fe3+/spermidine/putrescine transport system ATPase subunit